MNLSISLYFYQQYLVLFTMVPRDSRQHIALEWARIPSAVGGVDFHLHVGVVLPGLVAP